MSPEHRFRIFVVEDSTVLRDRLTDSLSALTNIQIVGWSDTEQGAIGELRRLQCDAVVLDLQLQDGSGLNVLKAIRESDPPEHRMLVIMLTNYASSIYRHRCLEAGADVFLDKAYDYDRLEQLLTAAAEGRTVARDW